MKKLSKLDKKQRRKSKTLLIKNFLNLMIKQRGKPIIYVLYNALYNIL